MTTVREENLHVVLEKDRNRVVLSVQGDVPFTAASIRATLGALRQFSYGPPDFMWSRMFGLRFILSLDDEQPPEFDLEALADLEIPLRVEQPADDSQPLRVQFIDTIRPSNDTAAVLGPQQVLTAYQLNALVDSWMHTSEMLQGAWFMRLENNCLAVAFRDAPRVLFARVANPIYAVTVDPTVHLYTDGAGHRTDQAKVTLRCRHVPRTFGPDFKSAAALSGFSDINERRRAISANYTGPEIHLASPELLIVELRKVTQKFMRALGVHPSLYGEFTVMIHGSSCALDGSHEHDLVLSQFAPITPM